MDCSRYTNRIVNCYHGSRFSSQNSSARYVVMFWLVLQLVTRLNASSLDGLETGNKTGNSVASLDLELHPTSPTRQVELTIIQNKTFKLTMNEERKVKINFTLYCSHPSILYSIRLTTEDANIAVVHDFQAFNISCSDHVFACGFNNNTFPPGLSPEGLSRNDRENDLTEEEMFSVDSIPNFQGSFNFTLKADLLGRTWLHIFGRRHADVGVIPDILIPPWNNPETSKTEPTSTQSANVHLEHGLHSSTTIQTNGMSVHSTSISYTLGPVYEPGNSVPSKYNSDSNILHGTTQIEGNMTDIEAEVQKYMVTVVRKIRSVDVAFQGILFGFVMMATVGMGCKTELSVVKEVLKKPVAPAIGFFCQYLIMPLIAFLLAKTVVVGDPALSLGIFACGICPGGGPSNMFTYLLDGDVSLSVTMTAISSVGALAMIPLWLFTLGTKFEDDKISLNVPFLRIILTLTFLIIPLFIGLAIKKWAPKVAKWILRVLKPFTLLLILFLLTFGVYTNLHVFRLFAPRTILAGCLLPYIGYILGGVISLLLRQPCYRVKTIAIETGIQNTSIAYLLLVFSLPDPDGDMAAVGPMASALMTPLPLFVLVLVYLLYKRCFSKKTKKGGEQYNGEKRGGEEEEAVALREQGLSEQKENLQESDFSDKV